MDLAIPTSRVLQTAPLALLGSLLLCAPQLFALRSLQPTALFREDHDRIEHLPFPWKGYIPALMFFAALAFVLARSWKAGALFLLGLALTASILILLTYGCLRVTSKLPKSLPLPVRLGFRHISRNRSTTGLSVLTVGLAALLISLIAQLQFGLQREFDVGTSGRPGLFLFDIQERQLEALSEYAKAGGSPLQEASPMIRARLISVNGEEFEKNLEDEAFQTRESERSRSLRNRGFNLSYRTKLAASEKVIRGRPFSELANPKGPANVSVEERFAKRLNWNIGDLLEFDVQGMKVAGRIASIRSVRWMSFEPNFFVLFQPGVLEGAPKTFLAVTPPMEPDIKASFQAGLAKAFPNVSSIDTQAVIDRVINMTSLMARALHWMAMFTLLAGLVTLWAMIRFDVYQRRWEINLFKVLGGRRGDLVSMMLLEVTGIAFISSLMGVMASIGLSALLLNLVFEAQPAVNVLAMIEVVAGISFLSALLTWNAAFRVWRERPQALLKAD